MKKSLSPEQKIILIDMNYTLCPELEYGLAADKAVDVFIDEAIRLGKIDKGFDREKFKFEKVFPQMKTAHTNFGGDDWNNRVFDKDNAGALAGLLGPDFEGVKQKAIEERVNFSKNYARENVSQEAIEAIKKLKEQGHYVVIVTDTNSSGAEPKLKAMGIDGLVDGVYCSRSVPEAMAGVKRLEKTKVTEFEKGIYKPSAKIYAEIALDFAKSKGLVPQNLSFDDVFGYKREKRYGDAVNKYIDQKLHVKDGKYSKIFKQIISQSIGFGDNNRDHLLYNNAGIYCAHAKFGEDMKNADGKKDGGYSFKVLEAISGWTRERLDLLGYAKVNIMAEVIKNIDKVCENFSDILDVAKNTALPKSKIR